MELNERTAQQQINDTCLFGRFGLPFPHGGKLRIVPLKKEVIDDNVPLFTDYGDDRNIVFDKTSNRALLRRSQISDAEMPNKIILTFEDEAHGNIQRPLSFSDKNAQLRAGKAMGDSTIRIVEKPYTAFGITNLGEAVRVGNLLRDLGEFDSGGLENNLRVTFTTWFTFTLSLHKYKVIRVRSRQLERYGFEYFRIMTMQRRPDLKAEITAQAYPVAYYNRLEDATLPPPTPGEDMDPNPGGGRDDFPCDVGFTEIGHTNDRIHFKLELC